MIDRTKDEKRTDQSEENWIKRKYKRHAIQERYSCMRKAKCQKKNEEEKVKILRTAGARTPT